MSNSHDLKDVVSYHGGNLTNLRDDQPAMGQVILLSLTATFNPTLVAATTVSCCFRVRRS